MEHHVIGLAFAHLPLVLACTVLLGVVGARAALPAITGKPVIDAPLLLQWPTDQAPADPNLNDPSSNTLFDFHANLSSCDLAFSTEGNYHPALQDIWPIFLAKFKDRPLGNWFYTTSPPVALPQIRNRTLQIGNLTATCKPSLVVATRRVIDKLEKAGYTEGQAYPLFQDRGIVILVKHGNPKNIRSVWDLGREGVRLVTPNPVMEPGAFENYLGSIYHIAANDPRPPRGLAPENLINRIFNGASRDPQKWLAGPRIHHRDVPWSVAYGRADAGVILYHLGRYTQQTFPDLFDLVPLGGTVAAPRPLPGTLIGTRFAVRIKGNWTPKQQEARETLLQTLLSEEFTVILEKRGLVRPPEPAPGAR
jgi:hypothetical protein